MLIGVFFRNFMIVKTFRNFMVIKTLKLCISTQPT